MKHEQQKLKSALELVILEFRKPGTLSEDSKREVVKILREIMK